MTKQTQKATMKWFRDNIVGLIIATLIGIIGWGGNEAFQYLKTKFEQMEAYRIEDIQSGAKLESRVTTLENRVDNYHGITPNDSSNGTH